MIPSDGSQQMAHSVQQTISMSSLPITVQNAQSSPELANMTVGQLLGQAQRRISITHVPNVTSRMNNNQQVPTSSLRMMPGGGITMAQVQQQPSTSNDASGISRPVFHTYRYDDNRVSMPTRKLIPSMDDQETYYKIDPNHPNQANPMSLEAVRSEQRTAHSMITAEQVRQAAFPHHQSAGAAPLSDEILTQNRGTSGGYMMAPSTGTGSTLESARLDDILKQIDPTSTLEDCVKEALMEFVDDFVEQVIDRSCKLSRHRGSNILEARDVEFILERYYKIPRVPRGGLSTLSKGDKEGANENTPRSADLTAHNQRIALIRKTLKKP